MTELNTVENIANHFAASLCAGDIEYISANLPSRSHIKRSLGLTIRNEYDLWHTHPLTANWRNNEAGRDIREGVDYSVDHPDQVSADIIEMVIAKVCGK